MLRSFLHKKSTLVSNYYLLMLIIAIQLTTNLSAQEKIKILPPDGSGFPEIKIDDHISEEHRKQIEITLKENIQQLQLQGLIDTASVSSASLLSNFQWPLRQADGFNYNSYYGISNYVDHNSNYPDAITDYNCGDRSYDLESGYNHQGIDIFTWPFGWDMMDDDQVEVVSIAAGTIIGKDDGNFDKNCSFTTAADWNAVYVRHADGTVAWYGHLKNGSLTSKSVGASVIAGEYLGVIGSSGRSSGPHLHLEIHASNNALLDPYSGTCNNLNGNSLWANQKPYYEPTLNVLLTHNDVPSDNGCYPDESNKSNNFTADDVVYFAAYYHDYLANQLTDFKIYQPNNTLWRDWSHSNTHTHFAAAYWYWYFTLPNNPQNGQWRFEATYQGQTLTHYFNVTGGNGETTNPICEAPLITCGNTYNGATTSEDYYNPNNMLSHCGSGDIGAPNTFYKLQGNGQDVTLALCDSDYDTRIDVYCLPANACSEASNFVCVAGNDDFCGVQSSVTFWARSGYDFYIMIHGYYREVGDFTMTTSCASHCPAPANASCEPNNTGHGFSGTAQSLTLQSNTPNPTYTIGNNTCTTTGINPSCDPFGQIQDVWYKFSTGSQNKVTIQTSLSAANNPAALVKFALYDGCSGNEVLCETPSGDLTVATANNLLTNHTYYVQVWSNSSEAGGFGIAVYAGDATAGCGALNTVNLHDEPIAPGQYYAETRVVSRGTVNGNVTMRAGSTINLYSGFHATVGSNFTAAIAPCTLSNFINTEEEHIDLPAINSSRTDISTKEVVLKVTPNPIQNQATIDFYCSKATLAKVKVFNSKGQLLTEQSMDNALGWNTTQLDASQLLGGIYYVVLQANNNLLTKKIIILAK